MSLTAPLPTEVETPQQNRKGDGLGVHKGGWFVRITILVVVLIWLIPTAGVLITSFRPEALSERTGWWTALANMT